MDNKVYRYQIRIHTHIHTYDMSTDIIDGGTERQLGNRSVVLHSSPASHSRTFSLISLSPLSGVQRRKAGEMRSIGWIHLFLLLQPLHIASAWHHQTPLSYFWSKKVHCSVTPPVSHAIVETSLVSRREWWTRLTSATTASIVGGSLLLVSPQSSRAATLVSTKAVCDPGVSAWKKDNRLVYLLGTAHISSASAVLAGDLVRDIHPTGVFVELDPKRVKGSGILATRLQEENPTAVGGSSGRELATSRIIVPNIEQISENLVATGTMVAEGGVETLPPRTTRPPSSSNNIPPPNPIMKAASQVVGNSIKGMYKKLDSAGFQAGEEFVVAIREGQKIGSDIILGDRDVEVTLRRVTEGLARTDLKALMNPDSELEQSLKELVPSKVSMNSNKDDDLSGLSDDEFREEFTSFVETMKARENVRKVMGQLEKIAPALYQALVSERDAYMAAGLNGLDELETIVAVVGVAHVDGIEHNLSMNGWKAILPTCAS